VFVKTFQGKKEGPNSVSCYLKAAFHPIYCKVQVIFLLPVKMLLGLVISCLEPISAGTLKIKVSKFVSHSPSGFSNIGLAFLFVLYQDKNWLEILITCKHHFPSCIFLDVGPKCLEPI
jgi:hypothetical protein